MDLLFNDEVIKQLKTPLVSGEPIKIKNIGEIRPLKIREICGLGELGSNSGIGEVKYNEYISVLTVGLEKVRDNLIENKNIPEDVKLFDILNENCKHDKEFKKTVLEGLNLFIKDKVYFLPNYSIFSIGDIESKRFIHRENYDYILGVLKLQNNMSLKPKKPKQKMSAKMKRLLEKRDQGRRTLAEARGQGELTLADIVSILGVFTNDIDKITNLTVYQLYNQYERFMNKVNYDANFAMMLAGADPKKLKLDKHWTANL